MFPGQYYYEKRQKAKKRLKIAMISLLILSVAAFGILMLLNRTDTTEVIKEVSVSPIVTDSKTTVEIKKLYRCGHMKTEIIDLPERLVNKSAYEISELIPEWHILKLTEELLTVEEKIESECDSHFVVKLHKNRLQAYKSNDLVVIYKEMFISTNSLTKEDIEILTFGIDVSSEYEMLEIFESFSELN